MPEAMVRDNLNGFPLGLCKELVLFHLKWKRSDITTETTYQGTANETTTDSTEQQPSSLPPRDSP